MKKIIMGLSVIVSLCLIGCTSPNRQYQGDWHQDNKTVQAIDQFIAFHDIERRTWTKAQALNHMKEYRRLYIENVLPMPKTGQKRVGINLMTQLCGQADQGPECGYYEGVESCTYTYVPGDVTFNFASKAGELDGLWIMYGAYNQGADAPGFYLRGKRVQDADGFTWMEEFEEKEIEK